MTLAEFKAWFEGFTENLDGPPNVEQWKRIAKRVKQLDGTITDRHVFIERYVTPYRRWYEPIYWASSGTRVSGQARRQAPSIEHLATLQGDFEAFVTAGRAEAASMGSA